MRKWSAIKLLMLLLFKTVSHVPFSNVYLKHKLYLGLLCCRIR
jgi:hypothetical protein